VVLLSLTADLCGRGPQAAPARAAS